jgi:hypothetical protein
MMLRPYAMVFCLLACKPEPSSAPLPPTTLPVELEPASSPAPAAEHAELADPTSENIGGVGLGDPAASVEAAFGPPTERSEVEEWGATGDRVSTWTWAGKGLEINMTEHAEGFVVLSIFVSAPCTATTSRGIGIGASWEDVDATYREFRGQGLNEDEEEEPQWDRDEIIVGSIYGGTFFDFEGGKVSSIFVGAGAE